MLEQDKIDEYSRLLKECEAAKQTAQQINTEIAMLKKQGIEKLQEKGYKSFKDLSLQYGVHKDYAEFFAPVCEDLFELEMRMKWITSLDIWNKTEFTGLNPKFDKQAKQLGYKDLNDVAKKYEKYGYNQYSFCIESAHYDNLSDMIKQLDHLFNDTDSFIPASIKSQPSTKISVKKLVTRIKSEIETRREIDQVYRMGLLYILIADEKEYRKFMKDFGEIIA
jgi:hypothetical protein